jgi:hypothetical protein
MYIWNKCPATWATNFKLWLFNLIPQWKQIILTTFHGKLSNSQASKISHAYMNINDIVLQKLRNMDYISVIRHVSYWSILSI